MYDGISINIYILIHLNRRKGHCLLAMLALFETCCNTLKRMMWRRMNHDEKSGKDSNACFFNEEEQNESLRQTEPEGRIGDTDSIAQPPASILHHHDDTIEIQATNGRANPRQLTAQRMLSQDRQNREDDIHFANLGLGETLTGNFPARLHHLLTMSENNEGENDISNIISWLPHGKSWIIHDKREFAMVLLRPHFNFNRFETFSYHVRAWGFQLMKDGPEVNSYYNEKFIRGKPRLVESMERISKGRHGRKHFFQMGNLHP